MPLTAASPLRSATRSLGWLPPKCVANAARSMPLIAPSLLKSALLVVRGGSGSIWAKITMQVPPAPSWTSVVTGPGGIVTFGFRRVAEHCWPAVERVVTFSTRVEPTGPPPRFGLRFAAVSLIVRPLASTRIGSVQCSLVEPCGTVIERSAGFGSPGCRTWKVKVPARPGSLQICSCVVCFSLVHVATTTPELEVVGSAIVTDRPGLVRLVPVCPGIVAPPVTLNAVAVVLSDWFSVRVTRALVGMKPTLAQPGFVVVPAGSERFWVSGGVVFGELTVKPNSSPAGIPRPPTLQTFSSTVPGPTARGPCSLFRKLILQLAPGSTSTVAGLLPVPVAGLTRLHAAPTPRKLAWAAAAAAVAAAAAAAAAGLHQD